MKEVCEFRIPEESIKLLPNLPVRKILGLGTRIKVAKLEVPTGSELFRELGKVDVELRRRGGALFTFWKIRRSYQPAELARAELFRMRVNIAFEPIGIDCGTLYDESAACGDCGAGPRQLSALRLDLRKIPRADIARTIANEVVASERFVAAFRDAGLNGADFPTVEHQPNFDKEAIDFGAVPSGRELLKHAIDQGVDLDSDRFREWINMPGQKELANSAKRETIEEKTKAYYRRTEKMRLPQVFQLMATSNRLNVIPATRTGLNPFDVDTAGRYRCPRGDTIGFHFLSEVTVSREDWDGADISLTRQCTGVPRADLIRPNPSILVSPRFRALMLREKFKGVSFEVAHFS